MIFRKSRVQGKGNCFTPQLKCMSHFTPPTEMTNGRVVGVLMVQIALALYSSSTNVQ